MYSGYRHDRRRFQRLSVNLSVFYKIMSPNVRSIFGSGEFEADTIDVGLGGMAFVTWKKIPVNTSLLITLILFKFDHCGLVSFNDPIEVPGEVCSSVLMDSGEYRLGVSFKQVREDERLEIHGFVNSSLRLTSIYSA